MLYYVVFLSLKIVNIFANSADPDGIPCYAAFHTGLYFSQSTYFTSSRMKMVKHVQFLNCLYNYKTILEFVCVM